MPSTAVLWGEKCNSDFSWPESVGTHRGSGRWLGRKQSQLEKYLQPWLVWLSGLNIKGLPVQFPVRAHAWVAGQVPSRGRVRGNHTLVFVSLSPSLPLCLKINK